MGSKLQVLVVALATGVLAADVLAVLMVLPPVRQMIVATTKFQKIDRRHHKFLNY
jgi:peptidoglycan biosynthesis protein MviN/MurJ (putative lipid II flippase)